MVESFRTQTRSRRITTIALVASALLAGATARADQISARKDPRVTGPLSLAAESCGTEDATHERKKIATVMSCLRLYEFDTKAETDLARNYGVGWVQTTVDPVNGWCATKIQSNLIVPQGMTLHSASPTRKFSPRRRSKQTVKLFTDAGGHGLEEGSVSQTFDLFPTSWRGRVTDDQDQVKTIWRGRESSSLAFALGGEVSWGALDDPTIRGGLGGMSFVKDRGC